VVPRRVVREQLGAEGDQFICPVCLFVLHKPVFTTCSHMLCETCLRDWVASKVQEAKARSGSATAKVELIPCPHAGCGVKLRKQDIAPLSSAKDSAARLCERMHKKLQVRCVNHQDHFRLSIGDASQQVARTDGITCKWTGDLGDYDSHLKNCSVQKHLDSVDSDDAEDASSKYLEQDDGGKGTTGSTSTRTPENLEAEVAATDADIRVAKHDYIPTSLTGEQISLKKGDLVQVLEVTDSGWAAGNLVNKKTMELIGDAGWFPIGYTVKAAS